MDNLLGVTGQKVSIDVEFPDETFFELNYQFERDILKEVSARRGKTGDGNPSVHNHYRHAVSLVTEGYEGILARTKGQIEAQELDGHDTVRDITDKLVPAIIRKLG